MRYFIFSFAFSIFLTSANAFQMSLADDWPKLDTKRVVEKKLVRGGAFFGVSSDYDSGQATAYKRFDIPLAMGVKILKVIPNSSAAAYDFQPGDIIQKFNGKDAIGDVPLSLEIRQLEIGETVIIEFQRKGSLYRIAVTLKGRVKIPAFIKRPKNLQGINVICL
jgi:S1-C subfamily serine protease